MKTLVTILSLIGKDVLQLFLILLVLAEVIVVLLATIGGRL